MTRSKWLALGVLCAFALGQGCALEVEEPGNRDETTTTAEALSGPESMTRGEIIALASTGVGYSYWWGHGRWDPSNHTAPGKCSGNCGACSHWAYPKGNSEYGADCSGYVAQVWQVPSTQTPKIDRHPYSTYNFRYQKTHWYPIKRSELQAGDALVYHAGNAGHVALFDHSTSGGKAIAYECSGCSKGCVHQPHYFGSAYIAIRRKGVEASEKKNPPKGQLETASCSKGLSGWAFDADTPKQPIDVILSFDGPLGGKSAKQVTVKASQKRSDLCKKLGDCNHGFTLALPVSLKDGKKHAVYAYAVGSDGKQKKLLIGAPRTLSCNEGTPPPTKSDGAGTSCTHDECASGAALTKDCSPCADAVCLLQPSCCDGANGSWDASCVALAGKTVQACRTVCYDGQSSCSHSECEAGGALTTSCSTCAKSVCTRDKYCCSGKWDYICANEAKQDPWCSCAN